MLRHNLPVVIVSFYTDQPTWGKIVGRKGLGVHIPVKKLTAERLIKAIGDAQAPGTVRNVSAMGERIRKEDGTERAVAEIETYFRM